MTSTVRHHGSFALGYLESMRVSQDMLSAVRSVGEAKGRQDLYTRQAPGVLETLRSVAQVQSIESSNRIEGVTAPPERLKALVEQKATPVDRSEREIAGYRDVLAMIHANSGTIRLTPGVVLQFHRDLFAYLPGGGGAWKATNNDIVDKFSDGSTRLRFKPVSAHQVQGAMDELQHGFTDALGAGRADPLVLVGAYVLDFLCIHPFRDGNGRIARLLTLLLLYQAGYEVGRYVSLERVIESSRDTYYESLERSSQGWHESGHDLRPWLDYFVGVLLAAYRELESRVGTITQARGYKRQMVIDCVMRLPEEFRVTDVERVCPGIPRPTINRVLGELRDAGRLESTGRGRDARWRQTGK
jgi:Fic family protein